MWADEIGGEIITGRGRSTNKDSGRSRILWVVCNDGSRRGSSWVGRSVLSPTLLRIASV